MACFLVPTTEAIAVTVVTKIAEKKVSKAECIEEKTIRENRQKPERKMIMKQLKWLSSMLWGGAVLLAFEHVWHGEVVPWFPFLTSASDPAARTEMLHEMGTTGVVMAVIVTAVWIGIVIVTNAAAKEKASTVAEIN